MAQNISCSPDNLSFTKTVNIAHHEESVHFLKDVLVLNQNFPKSWLNIAMFLTTVMLIGVVNIIVLVWVKVKDRLLIDKMVTMDCVANIMMIGLLLLAFPSRVWNNSFLCAVITFYRVFTTTIKKRVYFGLHH